MGSHVMKLLKLLSEAKAFSREIASMKVVSASVVIFFLLSASQEASGARNVLGSRLELCSVNPLTGWFRDGYCRTDRYDHGIHVVCATMTEEFLTFTKSRGNDLSTRRRGFPGLRPGDGWCLCAARWREAMNAGAAPLVNLQATHVKALHTVTLEQLNNYQE